MSNVIGRVRSIFKFAFEMDLIDRPAQFGPGFEKPKAKSLRKVREEKGEQDFTADEIKRLLAEAWPNMKAAVLMGINGGLGPTDLGLLKMQHVDLDSGWLNYARHKTGIGRRIPLWPETIKAIREVMPTRRKPKREEDADYLLISPHGKCYVRESCRRAKKEADGDGTMESEQISEERAYAFCYEFRRLTKEAGVVKKGWRKPPRKRDKATPRKVQPKRRHKARRCVEYTPPKFASAQDLRRSCLERLRDAGLPPLVLQAVARHASFETTTRYYAPGDVQATAAMLRGVKGHTLGVTLSHSTGEDE